MKLRFSNVLSTPEQVKFSIKARKKTRLLMQYATECSSSNSSSRWRRRRVNERTNGISISCDVVVVRLQEARTQEAPVCKRNTNWMATAKVIIGKEERIDDDGDGGDITWRSNSRKLAKMFDYIIENRNTGVWCVPRRSHQNFLIIIAKCQPVYYTCDMYKHYIR